MKDEWNLTEERPDNGVDVLAGFIGWDGIIFQRVLNYDNEGEEWSDERGDVYKNVIGWQHLPSDDNLKNLNK